LALLRALVRLRDVEELPLLDSLNRLASDSCRQPIQLRFVPALAHSAALYETRIHALNEIETREILHDLLNALAWLAFPAAKAAVNRVHVRELVAQALPQGRGTARDGATLFDESGLILLTDDHALTTDLASVSWQDLFVGGRARFIQHCRVVVIGHALAEKLIRPYKALTGHALILEVQTQALEAEPSVQLGLADARAAECIEQADFGPRCLVPIPVLGVPGWWAPNENAEFYADAMVFRTRGRAKRPRPK
jgi:hypothetical protein